MKESFPNADIFFNHDSDFDRINILLNTDYFRNKH